MSFLTLYNIIGCELVNRKTKRQYQEVKEQLVVNTASLFDQNTLTTNFIGFSISNSVLYLLTRGHVIACHVRVSFSSYCIFSNEIKQILGLKATK